MVGCFTCAKIIFFNSKSMCSHWTFFAFWLYVKKHPSPVGEASWWKGEVEKGCIMLSSPISLHMQSHTHTSVREASKAENIHLYTLFKSVLSQLGSKRDNQGDHTWVTELKIYFSPKISALAYRLSTLICKYLFRERYIRRQIFFNGNAKENVQDTVIMLTSMKIMRMKAEYKAQFLDTHALTRKYIVSINFSICSLGEEDKHFSKASTTDAVQYNMIHLWITQPIKQPQHRAYGNLRPRRTQLLFSVWKDRGWGREKNTYRERFLKRG